MKKKLKNEKYDLLIVHFIRKDFLTIALHLMPLAKKSIAAFWGSDMFRASKNTVRFKRIGLKRFDHINITTDVMLERFFQDYGHAFDGKISRARFGINGLSILKSCLTKPAGSISLPDIPKEKIVVAVGYNGFQAQQHLLVINELKKLSKEALDRIHLVFRMTYGGNSEYIATIKNEAKQLGCTYTVYSEYLSDEASAALTCVTDVFIHAQKTDALSASMLEHLYAGALVFNPVWIPYQELQNQDVFYFKYRSFEELGQLLEKNLMKKEQLQSPVEPEKMRSYIEKLASWECLKEDWKKIYHAENSR